MSVADGTPRDAGSPTTQSPHAAMLLTSAIVAAALRFDVVKIHHRMGWLRQRRVLLVTPTHVHNCHPDELRLPTKSFSFAAIGGVTIRGKEDVVLHVPDDHDFHYCAPNALHIAWELKRRIAAARAVLKVAPPQATELQRSRLLGSFCNGELPLPQFSASPDAPSGTTPDAMFVTMQALRFDVARALRDGAIAGAADVRALVLRAQSQSPTLGLATLRAAMNDIRETMLDDLLAEDGAPRSRGLPAGPISEQLAARCVEDVLQANVLMPLHERLWAELHLQSDVIGAENHFRAQCAALAREPPAFLGVSEQFLTIKYDLVLDQLQLVPRQPTPSLMLDVLLSVAKCIILTLRAVDAIDRQQLVLSPSSAAAGAAAGAVAAEMPRQAEVVTPREAEAAATDESAPPTPGASNDEQLSPAPSSNDVQKRLSAATSAAAARAATLASLAADDILPLYIHLLCHAAVPDLVFAREWIQRLGDASECTERTYYFTMFASAIEFISATRFGEDGVPIDPTIAADTTQSPAAAAAAAAPPAAATPVEDKPAVIVSADDQQRAAVSESETASRLVRAVSVSPFSDHALQQLLLDRQRLEGQSGSPSPRASLAAAHPVTTGAFLRENGRAKSFGPVKRTSFS